MSAIYLKSYRGILEFQLDDKEQKTKNKTKQNKTKQKRKTKTNKQTKKKATLSYVL